MNIRKEENGNPAILWAFTEYGVRLFFHPPAISCLRLSFSKQRALGFSNADKPFFVRYAFSVLGDVSHIPVESHGSDRRRYFDASCLQEERVILQSIYDGSADAVADEVRQNIEGQQNALRLAVSIWSNGSRSKYPFDIRHGHMHMRGFSLRKDFLNCERGSEILNEHPCH